MLPIIENDLSDLPQCSHDPERPGRILRTMLALPQGREPSEDQTTGREQLRRLPHAEAEDKPHCLQLERQEGKPRGAKSLDQSLFAGRNSRESNQNFELDKARTSSERLSALSARLEISDDKQNTKQ